MRSLKNFFVSISNPIRSFWCNYTRRKIAMGVLGILGLLVLIFGLYTYFDADRDYSKLDKERAEISETVQPGVDDPMILVAKYRDWKEAKNRREGSIFYIGMGLIGLGLAYFVSPEGKAQVDDTETPSFVAAQIENDNHPHG
ncbi:MAG TPA: hypothetical protein VHP83_22955 [Aggregatilineaceae bacterium]|nr:hypothetical protein [Aggregatilineaceae bacterium]